MRPSCRHWVRWPMTVSSGAVHACVNSMYPYPALCSQGSRPASQMTDTRAVHSIPDENVKNAAEHVAQFLQSSDVQLDQESLHALFAASADVVRCNEMWPPNMTTQHTAGAITCCSAMAEQRRDPRACRVRVGGGAGPYAVTAAQSGRCRAHPASIGQCSLFDMTAKGFLIFFAACRPGAATVARAVPVACVPGPGLSPGRH